MREQAFWCSFIYQCCELSRRKRLDRQIRAMEARRMSAVVIGGGVTGLALAHRLLVLGGGRIGVTVLEAQSSTGGRRALLSECSRMLRLVLQAHRTVHSRISLYVSIRLGTEQVPRRYTHGRRPAQPSCSRKWRDDAQANPREILACSHSSNTYIPAHQNVCV